MKVIVNESVPAKEECVTRMKDISDALYVLNGKWKFPLIFTLKQRPLRFNEIMQAIEGLTPKVLAKELKDLEMNGFIERKEIPTTPVTVTYSSTSYSDTLNGVLNELGQWGGQHREKVKQSMRDQYLELKKQS
jgi:DNA-binding HxlR family transcriptional regulator